MCGKLYRTVSQTYFAQSMMVLNNVRLPGEGGGRCSSSPARRITATFLAIILFFLLSHSAGFSQVLNSAEAAAFNAAARAFNVADYQLARSEFADFVRKLPQSAKVPEALLFQAQAALELGDS